VVNNEAQQSKGQPKAKASASGAGKDLLREAEEKKP
jgi:hypothetical protein